MTQLGITLRLQFIGAAFAIIAGWSNPRVNFVAQTGHTNAIDTIAFSPDGRLLASGGHDALIKVWDLRAGAELRAFAGHTNTVTSLAFSKDGKVVISGSLDATIRFWDIESGENIRTINRPNGVTAVGISPDDRLLASSGLEPDVTLWRLPGAEQSEVLHGHTKVVNSLSFSSDGRLLATASNDDSVRIWDLASGREIHKLTFPALHASGIMRDATTGGALEDSSKYNTDCVTSVVFSPDNKSLGTASYNVKDFGVNGVSFTIGLWDVATAKQIRTIDSFMGGGPASFIFLSDHNAGAGSLSFSSDGKSMLATGFDYTIKQWDAKTGRLIKALPIISWPKPSEAHDILVKFQSIRWDPPRLPTFSPDGKTAAVAFENGISLWDVAAGKQLKYLGALAASVSSVSFSADGTTLATANSFQPTRLWDLLSGGNPRTLDRGQFPPGAGSVAFSPKQNLLATAALDIRNSTGFVDLWDPKEGKKLRTIQGSSAGELGIAFDATGEKLAIGRIDDSVALFSALTGQKIRTFAKTTYSANVVALSADGSILAHASSGTQSVQIPHAEVSLQNPEMQRMREAKPSITVWNTETGAVLFTQQNDHESLWSVSVSPDGKLLAVGGTNTFIWDITTHHLMKRFDMPSTVVAFSPDGNILAIGRNIDVQLWNVSDLTAKGILAGHVGRVTSLAFDGSRRLATGSQDGSSKIWDLTTYTEVVTLFPLGNDDYVIGTPENYYMTSRTGLHGVAFRAGLSVYPFEQFDLKYNRPDLVLKRLGAATPEVLNGLSALAEERAKRLGFDIQQLGDDFHLPELRIADPGLPLSSSTPSVRFTVSAEDSLYELKGINVYVNGVPLRGFEGSSLSNRHTKLVSIELAVPLASGNNKIQVSAVNEKGVESLANTTEVTYTGKTETPNLYLLAVGVSQYKASSNNLMYAATDARAMQEFWQSGARQFKTVHATVLADSQATRERILAERSFLAEAGVNDVVILFFAGHGELDSDGKYYFGTWDFNSGVPNERGLQYGAIENLVDGIKARKKLILIDTCHAGSDDQEALLRERFTDLRRGTGAHVIAASGSFKNAVESNQLGRGVFTYAVLEGLNGKADDDHDGEVTVSELRDYVAKQVEILSQKNQIPSIRAENIDLNFTLARTH